MSPLSAPVTVLVKAGLAAPYGRLALPTVTISCAGVTLSVPGTTVTTELAADGPSYRRSGRVRNEDRIAIEGAARVAAELRIRLPILAACIEHCDGKRRTCDCECSGDIRDGVVGEVRPARRGDRRDDGIVADRAGDRRRVGVGKRDIVPGGKASDRAGEGRVRRSV